MRLDPDEVQSIADSLAPRVAEILERRLNESPEWAMSVPEIAAYCKVDERCVRDAIESGRLPAIRIGRQLRVRRSDLFAVKGGTQ